MRRRSQPAADRPAPTPGRPTRVDLHCHSKYSDDSDEWILRLTAAPESVMEPAEVYRLCRRRGMDFVTLSDHDRIEGALEIAHLPGVFVSCEVTVAFPEDGCQVHVLASGISEGEHREMQRLRGDLYAFCDYAAEAGIVTTLAHPFYRVNDLLTLDHVERLILLFQRFEARNGIHDGGGNALVEELFAGLGPADVERMANRHGVEPRGERPWVKHLTGGSDDHGGFYVGTTWTETPAASTVEELLDHLRGGASVPGGAAGSTHRLAQSIYAIADGYCTRDLGDGLAGRAMDPFRATLRRLGLPEGGRRRRWFSLPARLLGLGGGDAGPRRSPAPEATWKRADRALRKAVRRFAFRARRELGRGHLAGGLGALAHLAPAAAAVAPWLFAARAQHKDAAFLRQARRHFAVGRENGPRPKAWFTDTYGDVNGVARTVAAVAGRAGELGRPQGAGGGRHLRAGGGQGREPGGHGPELRRGDGALARRRRPAPRHGQAGCGGGPGTVVGRVHRRAVADGDGGGAGGRGGGEPGCGEDRSDRLRSGPVEGAASRLGEGPGWLLWVGRLPGREGCSRRAGGCAAGVGVES